MKVQNTDGKNNRIEQRNEQSNNNSCKPQHPHFSIIPQQGYRRVTSFSFFLVFLQQDWVCTQGLILAKQTLFHSSPTSSPRV
jgi:hypothetical protein